MGRLRAAVIPAILLLYSVSLMAQPATLRGRVTDEAGVPLISANVALRGTVLGSATDVEGRYRIAAIPPGRPLVLSCSMIGYSTFSVTLTLQAGEERVLDITLKESSISTGEVIVTAGKHAQSLEEVPVSVSTWDARDIQERGITSLDNALRRIPGVNITEDQINIRGSSGYSRAVGSRVLLLVDGAPVLAGDAGEVKFDAVPMFNVERIEVVKGAGSALYGSSALGGVINVITTEPRESMLRVRAHAGAWDEPRHDQWIWWGSGAQWMAGMDAMYGDARGPLAYSIAGGLRRDQGYRQLDDNTEWNLNGRAWYRFSPERNLSVSSSYSSNERGNWVFWRDLAHAMQPPADKDLTERVHSTKWHSTALYRVTHGPRFASTSRLSVYRTAFDTESDTSDFSLRPSDKVQSTAMQASAEWQGTWAMSRDQLLTFGSELSYSWVDARIYGQRDGYGVALYAQDDVALGERLHLSAGARFDATSIDTLETDMQVNPRLGIAWKPWNETTVRASYGWGFRSPSIAERFATASSGGIITKPNPTLQAERSTSYEFGIRRTLPWATVLDAAVFWNDYSNLEEPTVDPADGRVVFRNITEARIRGYELTFESEPWGLFYCSAAYTYLFPEDLSDGSVLKYRPRHLLYVAAGLHWGAFRFGVDARYVSRMETLDKELTIVIPDADRRVATYVTDLRLSWSGAFMGLPLRCTALVDNVFNYHYTEVIGNLSPIRHYRLMVETGL